MVIAFSYFHEVVFSALTLNHSCFFSAMTFSFSLCSGLNNNIPRITRIAISDMFAGTIGTKNEIGGTIEPLGKFGTRVKMGGHLDMAFWPHGPWPMMKVGMVFDNFLPSTSFNLTNLLSKSRPKGILAVNMA